MIQLILILDNLRSSHNVGAILRTADAIGVERVIMTGITPYPAIPNDSRDPRIIKRNTSAIAKTALGAESTLTIEHMNSSELAIASCLTAKRTIYGLEQAPHSINLLTAKLLLPAALVVGSETQGIAPSTLALCHQVLELPQYGSKESLNAAVAAGVALYRFVES